MMRLCAVMVLFLLGGLISVQATPAPHPHWSVGFHRMTFLDPLDLQPMKAVAFYPSTDLEHSTQLGPYHVAATEDAKIAIGRFPMFMLSHGNTGTPMALHDLATSLARKGFVVVAVLHPEFHLAVGNLPEKMPGQSGVESQHVIGVAHAHQGVVGGGLQFGQLPAQHFRPAMVQRGDAGLHVPLPGADARAFDDAGQPPASSCRAVSACLRRVMSRTADRVGTKCPPASRTAASVSTVRRRA